MAVLKCKMCGGNLDLVDDSTVIECEYCGTKQTVPTADNEKKMTLFARANRLRSACEFDKAAGVYESIVAEFPEEAEAYWGLVLCKYGIEYVDDTATGKKIPTCHRSSFDSIMDDNDFEQVMENADSIARRVYREEAKTIEDIRKGILEVSSKEEPYDIFICYKETDEDGNRTIDSVIAQDIYDNLTEKGYRVFFARISLEDKLGQEYEPYIFAALNSAKVMLAIGTDYDYYNAVWVKNEWSRFLALIAKGEKKTLIPCYKDIDAYDIPKEFKHLQAQDMGKVGAMQDLLRGIGKLLPKKEQAYSSQPQPVQTAGPNTDSLLERAFIFIADGEWEKADEYCEKVLDINPKCSRAYLGKLLVEYKVSAVDSLPMVMKSIRNSANYKRILQYADDGLKQQIMEISYTKARLLQETDEIDSLLKAAEEFKCLDNYKDSADLAEKCVRACEKKKALYKDHRNRVAHYDKMIMAGDYFTLGLKTNGTVVAVGSNHYCQINVNNWKDIVAMATGGSHTVGLKTDGTVVAVGDNEYGQCAVWNWTNIVAIAAGYNYTVGLKSDGTVVAVGDNKYGQCDVEDWTDIVSVVSGHYFVVGLKSDGTIVAVGRTNKGQCDVEDWKDIIAIAVGDEHTVGLKSDGTVVAVGINYDGRCDVGNWTDIVTISAVGEYTVGLKSDGTVVAVGNNNHGQCKLKNWKDIIAIYAGDFHTVGLKMDGTVVAVGLNDYGECDVIKWKDIVAIAIGSFHTIGLKSDGTVVAVGKNDDGQCKVNNWKIFKTEEDKEVGNDIVHDLQRLDEKKRANNTMKACENICQIYSRLEPLKGRVAANFFGTYMLRLDGTLWQTNKTVDIDLRLCCNLKKVIVDGVNMICLRKDGTLFSRMINKEVNRIVSSWSGFVDVAVGNYHVVGLKPDGSVVSIMEKLDSEHADLDKGQCKTQSWRDIKSVYASEDVSVGLRNDGTVVFAGDNNYHVDLCQQWTDIIEIAIGLNHIIGLRADGTVVAVGFNGYEDNSRCDVSSWDEIVAVAAGNEHSVALRADGTVLATGENEEGQCNVSTWKNVVAIAAGSNHTVALCSDGTLLATGSNEYGKCNVQGIRMFYSLDTFEEEEARVVDMVKKQRETYIAALNAEKKNLLNERSNLKGMFTGKRRREIDTRLAQIDTELKAL